MDVRHLAFLARQPSAEIQPRERFWGISKRGLALILANALFWQPLWAEAGGITVSGQGTSLNAAGNGVPIVNIAAPNASGLSHNQYSDYNVGSQGLILNNATSSTQSTQLGGIIVGNGNLKGTAATTILNEVTGTNRSQLNGYTEVAGQAAHVIVANPYGITCNGCGFINTPRATLTTGTPVLDASGKLDHYQVDGGDVAIDGAGINANNVDSFEVITRSARINGQINANQLTVIAGRNDVDATTLQTTARADDGSTKPTLAIDSTALGGMYANTIKLVGTEQGVGVNLAGNLAASGGDIELDANGHLNVAQTAASGAVTVNAQSVATQGPVYAGSHLNVTTRGDLNNNQNLAARDAITLSSGGQLSNSGIIEAGVNADNSRNTTGDVSVSAQNLSNSGSVIASRTLSAQVAQTLTNQGGTLSAQQQVQASATTLDNQNKGRVMSTGTLGLTVGQLLNAQGGLVTSNGALTVQSGYVNNNGGELSSLADVTLNLASLDSVAGLVNAGTTVTLNASGALNNQGGTITATSAVNLTAGQVDNSQAGHISSAGALTASVSGLDQHAKGQLSASGALTLNLNHGLLDNQNGLITSPGLLKLDNLAAVANQGGEISSQQAFALAASSLDNSNGKVTSQQSLVLRIDQALSNIAGLVSANGIDARAGSLDNSNGSIDSNADLTLTVGGALLNHNGELSSAATTQIQAASLDNSNGQANGDTALTVGLSGALNNQQGTLGAGQAVSISAASLDNSNAGSLVSNASLTTHVTGVLDNHHQGSISAKGAVDLHSGSLANQAGSITADGTLSLATGSADNTSGQITSKRNLTASVGDLSQQGGELESQAALTLTGSTLDNRNGGIVAANQPLVLALNSIDNRGGKLSSAASVAITGQSLNNSNGGKVLAGTALGLTVAQVINQAKGLLSSQGRVTLQGLSLDNSGGTLSALSALNIDLANALTNTRGLLDSEGSLRVTSASLDNTSGSLSSATALSLTTTGAVLNEGGAITTDQNLTLASASLDNQQQGTLSGGGVTRVTTGQFDNGQGGSLTSGGTLALTAGQLNNGSAGRIASTDALTASITGLNQQGGQLFSNTQLNLDLNQGQLTNGGLINAPILVLKNLAGVDNSHGEISSPQAFSFSADSLTNTSGKLISDQGLTLVVNQALSNINGMISAAVLTSHSTSLDNSGGTLSSQGDLNLGVTQALGNQNGTLLSDGNLLLSAANLDNTNGSISGKGDVNASVASLINPNGELFASGALTLTGTTLDNRQNGLVGALNAMALNVASIDNRGGELSSNTGLTVTGQSLNNSDGGLVIATQGLGLNVAHVLNRNAGQLTGKAGLTLTGQTLDNTGGTLSSLHNLQVTLTSDLLNPQGLLSSEGTLTVSAASLANQQGSLSSAGLLSLTTPGAVNNHGGQLVTDGGLNLSSARLDNSQKGTLSAKGAMTLATGAFDNSQGGGVSGGDSLTLTAGQLNNASGQIASQAALTANLTGLAQAGGQLFSNTALTLDLNHGALTNTSGLINAPVLVLNNLAAVDNSSGEISSAQAFTFNADSLTNDGGKLLSNQSLNVLVNQALSNLNGTIAAAALQVQAASLDNAGGTLNSQGDLALIVNGQLTNNHLGLVNAGGNLAITAAGIDNSTGGNLLGSAIALDFGTATGDLNNASGLITTTGNLTVKHLRDLNNQNGELSTGQSLTLAGRTLDNTSGKLISDNLLTLTANSLLNPGGLISGWQGVTISAASLDNRNTGTVSSRYGDVTVNVQGDLLNGNNGALVSQGALNVSANYLDNTAGILSSGAGQTLTVANLLNNSQGGLIDSGAGLTLQAMSLNNNAGTLNAQTALAFTGTSFDNTSGSVAANGTGTLNLLGVLTNTHGKLATGSDLLMQGATQVNNENGQLASQTLLTLLTGGLDNSQGGTVAANGALNITASGAVQNNGNGLIYSQNAAVNLHAASLANSQGTLQAGTALSVTTSGDINNQSGTLLAQNDALTVTANTLDSRGGTLSSLKAAFTAYLTGALKNGYDLSNNSKKGTIQAQSLNLTSTGLDNDGGRIAAQTGDAVISTGDFNNQNGGLYAGGKVNVTAHDLDNSGAADGQIGGQQIDLSLSGALNNENGIVESDSTLGIAAASIDNQTGKLRALGATGSTTLNISGLLNNSNGTLESANQNLTLNAGSFLNANGSLLHVGTGTFAIATANLTNAGGSVVTNGSLTIAADNWTNSSVIQAGELTVNVNTLNQTASGELLGTRSLTGNGATWNNDGLLASDGTLGLTLSGSYGGNGRLTSTGDMNLSAGHITLGSATSIAGGGNTTVNLAGQLSNAGRLTSGAALTVNAAGVDNEGTLGSGTGLILTTGALSNTQGLIFSGGDMSLRVASLNNSYANIYSLGNLTIDRDGQGGLADSIVNSSSTLQSDGNMSLAASTIQNVRAILNVDNAGTYTADIVELPCNTAYEGDCEGGNRNGLFQVTQRSKLEVTDASAASGITSGGDLALTGGDFLNSSSTVATSGNLTAQLTNLTNQGVETSDTEDSRTYVSARHNLGNVEQAANTFSRQYWYLNSGYDANNLSGLPAALAHFLSITESEVKSLHTTTQLSGGDQSYAAVIQAGGAVNISTQNNFDSSVITPGFDYVGAGARTDTTAPGTAYSTHVTLNAQLPPNLAQQEVDPLTLPGFSLPTGQNGLFRLSGQSGSTGSASSAPQSWTLASGQLTGAQAQVATPVAQARALQVGSVAQASGSSVLLQQTTRTTTGTGTPVSTLQVSAPSTTGATVPAHESADTSVTQASTPVTTTVTTQTVARVQGVPDTSTQSQPQKYLIETNPALTNLKQFMSSDYMLSALGYNPDASEKRLGDGLYEQTLVDQAIVAKTGARFIDGQTSDAAQFKYLMDNGVAAQQSLNLTVGTALTAEQVAALTHDIVWMQSEVVDGQTVLVPVLYLANANNRLAANGALVEGSDVSIIAGSDLTNAGTLKATGSLSAIAGNNLTNTGVVQADSRLDLLAGNTLTNQSGGIIAGRDVSLTAVDGDVNNDRTVTSHQSAEGSATETTDFVDSAARVEAANSLTINAGQDVNNSGGVLTSGAATTITAGRDVNITAAQATDSATRTANHTSSTITQNGSTITSGADLTISAGRDLTAVASQLSAKGDVALSATDNLSLSSAADETHSYNKTKKVTAQDDQVTQVATTVTAGGSASLTAGQDLTLTSSNVTAGTDAYVYAGDKLQLLAAQNSDYSLYDMNKRGSWGSHKTQHDEVTKTTNVGSVVTGGGNLTLASGSDQLYQAAKLNSGNDLTVTSGGAVTFQGVKDLDQETHLKSNSDLAWTSSKGKGSTDETLQQTQMTAKGKTVINAVNGLNIDVKQINQETVSQVIDTMVKADPSLSWLKDAETRGDVNWQQVKEVHDSFKYSTRGLGAGAEIILAIAMSLVMGPAGLGLGTISAAGAGSLATTAISSTISNNGNLGLALKDTLSASSLKSAAVAMATAGVAANYIDPEFSGTQVPLSNLTKGFDLSTLAGIGGFAVNAGVNGIASSVITTAIEGGSFSKNLTGSLISSAANVAAAVGFNAIGGYAETKYLDAQKAGDIVGEAMWGEGGVARTALHAVLGGAITSADGGDFATGAIAAGASEAMAGVLNTTFKNDPTLRSAMSQVVGVLATGVAGKDEAQGSWIAQMGDEYNRQLHQPEAVALSNLKAAHPEDADKYDAAACALVNCSASVPPDYTPGSDYLKLTSMEAAGKTYIAQEGALIDTGAFTYNPIDTLNDSMLAGGEVTQRIASGAKAVTSVIAGVSLSAVTAAEAPLCVSVIGCAAPAFTGALSAASLNDGRVYTDETFAPYTNSQASDVLKSFDPATYPGESNPVGSLINSVGLFGAGAVGGKVLSSLGSVGSEVQGSGLELGSEVKSGLDEAEDLFGSAGDSEAQPKLETAATDTKVGNGGASSSNSEGLTSPSEQVASLGQATSPSVTQASTSGVDEGAPLVAAGGVNAGLVTDANAGVSWGAAEEVAGAKATGDAAGKVDDLASTKVKWVDENAGMSSRARDYNDSATGARSNPATQSGQAPALERTMPDGSTKLVKFDGVDGEVLVDRKISVVTTSKSKDQALRQSDVLSQNGLTARWEVPTQAQANRAQKMFDELGIKNISVKVIREPGNQ